MSRRLIDAHLEDLLDFLVSEIRGLDEKLRQRRVTSDHRNAYRFGAWRWQWAGKLGWWRGIAADEHNRSRLRAFAQHINQPIEQIASERHQFSVGVVSLCVALKGEEQPLLIGKDTLGIRWECGLIDFTADLFWRGANRAQPIKNKRAEL
jgi:hypothetical protein